MCRFWLAVVISQFLKLAVLIRMQISFAVVVSGFGLNVKYRTYSSGACATEYYSCSHLLLRPEMSSGASVKLFNHLNVIALINIRSL